MPLSLDRTCCLLDQWPSETAAAGLASVPRSYELVDQAILLYSPDSMWQFVDSAKSSLIESLNGCVGRQTWKYDAAAGTAEQRQDVQRLQESFRLHRCVSQRPDQCSTKDKRASPPPASRTTILSTNDAPFKGQAERQRQQHQGSCGAGMSSGTALTSC